MKGAVILVAGLAGVGALGLSAGHRADGKVGEYATPIELRNSAQRHNATLALARLDGAVVPPGAVFSFNETIGPWTQDRGYRKAPVSFGGMLVDAFGGGVCQTSTTLFNAALLAGMVIVERHSHYHAPDYVPAGRDAAVAHPNIDLKFRNPYKRAVTIRGTAQGSVLRVWIEGPVAPPRASVWTQVRRAVQPSEFTFGEGRRARVRNPGKPGYDVVSYRTLNGKTERLAHDNYPVMERVLERREPSSDRLD
ncbi:MAG: VanW family protein [Fimbriimonadaceae bacterium]|nr:VanW family protein [Fimbriimonadaceae bacterium]